MSQRLINVVTKIPKWPFDKFDYANRRLGTQMKATGEVMAIDRTFESSLLKAVVSLEGKETGLRKEYMSNWSLDMLKKILLMSMMIVSLLLHKLFDMD